MKCPPGSRGIFTLQPTLLEGTTLDRTHHYLAGHLRSGDNTGLFSGSQEAHSQPSSAFFMATNGMVIASRTIPFPLRRLLGHNPSTQVRFQLFVRVVESFDSFLAPLLSQ
jgi:hypothetical protein